MKRLVAVFLIFSILVCGCSEQQPNSTPQSSSGTQSSSLIDGNSVLQSSSKLDMNPPTNKYSSNTKFRRYIKDRIMPFDGGKSDEYNNAMRIYMTYLVMSYTAEHTELIDSFCFHDMNGDDIPELIISKFYHIYVGSANNDDGIIEWWEDTGHCAMNGPTKVLANGMLASRSSSTGTSYTFIRYDDKGQATTTSFFIDPPKMYRFMGKDVTEEEFNQLAGPYLSAWENEVELDWITYWHAVVGIPNNQPFIQTGEIDNQSAVDAYNKLLSDKFYDFNYDFYRSYYVENYGLFDMNGDNMPELILQIRQGYFIDNEIWSYIDGQLIQFDTPQMWTMNGRIKIMNNGMIGYSHSGSNYYRFYIYERDGSCAEKVFSKGYNSFAIDGKDVSENEYNTVIAYYLEEFEKDTEIKWRPYFAE